MERVKGQEREGEEILFCLSLFIHFYFYFFATNGLNIKYQYSNACNCESSSDPPPPPQKRDSSGRDNDTHRYILDSLEAERKQLEDDTKQIHDLRLEFAMENVSHSNAAKQPDANVQNLESNSQNIKSIDNEPISDKMAKIQCVVQFSCELISDQQITISQIDDHQLTSQVQGVLSGKADVHNVKAQPLETDNGIHLHFDVHFALDTTEQERVDLFINDIQNSLSDASFAESLANVVDAINKIPIKSWNVTHKKID
ncbi:hypothetical protein RFI_16727 [Reticulomyxa filosa]|uniref:Uncharacterized protein n=1 Tax=Reticulomyxa filosa TaxID=46433 RepID=X6N2K4_RETFI|nr:hypothetical protein RFI_16727 [Reticulomyxa filosa]|eukprot:ETO20490.1 hypothetical protein RFI_16727 [Reticulomyxa filosa]